MIIEVTDFIRKKNVKFRSFCCVMQSSVFHVNLRGVGEELKIWGFGDVIFLKVVSLTEPMKKADKIGFSSASQSSFQVNSFLLCFCL